MLQAIHSFYPPPTTEGSSTEENPLVLSQVTPQGRASIPPPPSHALQPGQAHKGPKASRAESMKRALHSYSSSRYAEPEEECLAMPEIAQCTKPGP